MGVALSGGREDDLLQKNFFYPTRTYAFRGGRAGRPPGNGKPPFRGPNYSRDIGLSADVSFVSVLAMVLSENWKNAGGKFFHNFVILRNRGYNLFFKNFPPVFFNILKEPLLVQKQTIHQQKALDLSFNLAH